jgi:hypothetical protein
METTSPNTELSVVSIIGNGFALGLKNVLSLTGALILWLLTIWIPYLNVGTTIGFITLAVAMSKGAVISPLEIFEARYRKYMGEFFILAGLNQLGKLVGFVFMIIPGIVISIAWSQAFYLLIDKKLSPMEALKVSNDITYGHKWTIFFGILLLTLIFLSAFLVGLILMWRINSIAGILSMVIIELVFFAVLFGAMAHIYGRLSQKLN